MPPHTLLRSRQHLQQHHVEVPIPDGNKSRLIKVLALFIMTLFPPWHLIDWYNGFYRLFISLLPQWINTSLHAWLNRLPGTLVCICKRPLMLHYELTWMICFFARACGWLHVSGLLVNEWGRYYKTTKLIRCIVINPQSKSSVALYYWP